jgi:hypothetical protein
MTKVLTKMAKTAKMAKMDIIGCTKNHLTTKMILGKNRTLSVDFTFLFGPLEVVKKIKTFLNILLGATKKKVNCFFFPL